MTAPAPSPTTKTPRLQRDRWAPRGEDGRYDAVDAFGRRLTTDTFLGASTAVLWQIREGLL